jgi:hypothetical protein
MHLTRVLVMLCSVFPALASSKTELPAAAEAAVKALYPGSSVAAIHVERENGVPYYEVTLRQGSTERDVEVTAEGTIGEIESAVAWADLPGTTREGILKSSGNVVPLEVERHEVRGRPEGGRFVAVNPPIVFFEATYDSAGKRQEIAVTADGRLLPPEGEDDDAEADEDDPEDD